jgi:site-specific recombinase
MASQQERAPTDARRRAERLEQFTARVAAMTDLFAIDGAADRREIALDEIMYTSVDVQLEGGSRTP